MEDYDAAIALWRETDGLGLSEADSRKGIERYLARNPHLSFVAVVGDKLVGTVLGGHDGRRGYLHHLAVHPDYRRKGLGTLLAERCLEALRAEGIAKCHHFVIEGNQTAEAFWNAAGWNYRGAIRLYSKSL